MSIIENYKDYIKQMKNLNNRVFIWTTGIKDERQTEIINYLLEKGKRNERNTKENNI